MITQYHSISSLGGIPPNLPPYLTLNQKHGRLLKLIFQKGKHGQDKLTPSDSLLHPKTANLLGQVPLFKSTSQFTMHVQLLKCHLEPNQFLELNSNTKPFQHSQTTQNTIQNNPISNCALYSPEGWVGRKRDEDNLTEPRLLIKTGSYNHSLIRLVHAHLDRE